MAFILKDVMDAEKLLYRLRLEARAALLYTRDSYNPDFLEPGPNWSNPIVYVTNDAGVRFNDDESVDVIFYGDKIAAYYDSHYHWMKDSGPEIGSVVKSICEKVLTLLQPYLKDTLSIKRRQRLSQYLEETDA